MELEIILKNGKTFFKQFYIQIAHISSSSMNCFSFIETVPVFFLSKFKKIYVFWKLFSFQNSKLMAKIPIYKHVIWLNDSMHRRNRIEKNETKKESFFLCFEKQLLIVVVDVKCIVKILSIYNQNIVSILF